MEIIPLGYAMNYIKLEHGNNQSDVIHIDKYFPINIHSAKHKFIMILLYGIFI